jgi:hypothetical protein
MRKPIFAVSIALLVGLVLFGLSLVATRTPEGSVNGYPLTINHAAHCLLPNPFSTCGFVYNPSIILLDFLFWMGIGLIPAVPLAFVLIPPSGAAN